MARVLGFAAAVAVAALGLATVANAGIEEYEIEVYVGDLEVEYHYDELMKMGKKIAPSSRNTKFQMAIPIRELIKKSQSREREYNQVVILSPERTLLFEGSQLDYLDHLWLKLGDNHASIMADSPESYEKVRGLLGKPRFKNPMKIFVYELGEK